MKKLKDTHNNQSTSIKFILSITHLQWDKHYFKIYYSLQKISTYIRSHLENLINFVVVFYFI